MEIFGYQFFQNALIGSLFACLACAITGTYAVTRRLLFISGGISHASFGGVGLGMFLGINPTIPAFLFAIASAIGVQKAGESKEIREDSAIAVFWVLGMTLGVIFCFMTPNYTGDLSTYLFGNILTISLFDILLLACIALTLLLFTIIFFRTIIFVAFDSEFATTRNIPVRLFEYLMMTFIALTIVATLRLVGVVLVISMLTIPQMTALIFTKNYRNTIILSVVFGYLACIAGLYISYIADIPSGASIIICSISLYLFCMTTKRLTDKYKTCFYFLQRVQNILEVYLKNGKKSIDK